MKCPLLRALVRFAAELTIAVCEHIIDAIDGRPDINALLPAGAAPADEFSGWQFTPSEPWDDGPFS
jgi:hypothetical protein